MFQHEYYSLIHSDKRSPLFGCNVYIKAVSFLINVFVVPSKLSLITVNDYMKYFLSAIIKDNNIFFSFGKCFNVHFYIISKVYFQLKHNEKRNMKKLINDIFENKYLCCMCDVV